MRISGLGCLMGLLIVVAGDSLPGKLHEQLWYR